MSAKPYWEMSRVEIANLGRFDWFYKNQKTRATTSESKPQNEKRIGSSIKPQRKPERNNPLDVIEHVGYKPSEYKAIPPPVPLRGLTAPAEHGKRDIFKDLHTPIQVTKKFMGAPVLSVPIRGKPESQIAKTVVHKRALNQPIHDVLFDESVDQKEIIDPWGFTPQEKVDVPETVFKGIKLRVSRMKSE